MMKDFDKEITSIMDRCIYPGCNIDTNARYFYRGDWFAVCMVKHLEKKMVVAMYDDLYPKEDKVS